MSGRAKHAAWWEIARRIWLMPALPVGLVPGPLGSLARGQDEVASFNAQVPDLRKASEGQVWAVAFSPDGRTLAGGHFDGELTLWDVDTRMSRATLELHDHVILGVSFAHDGRYLATAGIDKTAKPWRIRTDLPRRISSRSRIPIPGGSQCSGDESGSSRLPSC